MIETKIPDRVKEFLKGITRKDKVCIIHDTDPDGVCSAVIMAKCIERLRNRKIDLHIPLDKKQYGITQKMIKTVKKAGISKLITADFSAEQDLKTLKELEKQAEILVIDHHKVYSEYQSSRTILYKPQFFTTVEPNMYCTAKLAYDAASSVAKAEDLDWIAATACIADIATSPWKEWLSEVFKKYKVKPNKDLFRTKLGQTAATISSVEVYDARLVPKCFDEFYNAKKPEDILFSRLGKYKKIIDKELGKHMQLFKKAEKSKETRIYEMSSKYRIHSPLSTILGLKYQHNTIIIINKIDGSIAVSARRGDKKTAMNNLLEEAIKGFKGANAGGHTPAAGAGFHKKYLKQFKERIRKWSQKQDWQ